MKKQLTAAKLLKFLLQWEKNGADLKTIKMNYRHDYDADVVPIREVAEDLYDEVTNNRLTHIVFVTDPSAK